MMPNFQDPKFIRFFHIYASFIFLVICVANIFTIIKSWEFLLLSAKVSAMAMASFYLLLSLFFFGSWRRMKPKIEPISEEDVNKIFKEAE